jgi:hypothetical protein
VTRTRHLPSSWFWQGIEISSVQLMDPTRRREGDTEINLKKRRKVVEWIYLA